MVDVLKRKFLTKNRTNSTSLVLKRMVTNDCQRIGGGK